MLIYISFEFNKTLLVYCYFAGFQGKGKSSLQLDKRKKDLHRSAPQNVKRKLSLS